MTYSSPSLQKTLSHLKKFIPKSWNQPLQNSSETSIFEQKLRLDHLSLSLQTSARHGNLFQAFKTYSSIQHSVSASRYSYSLLVLHSISSLILCCNNTFKFFPQGKQLHGHIITLGLHQNPVLVPKFATFYINFGLLGDAHLVAAKSRCTFGWNLLISAYVKYGLCKEAISVYKQMVVLGVKPDEFTYPSVLKACGSELDLGFGKEVHRCIDESSVGSDLCVHNALVGMYVKCGELNAARRLFDKMPTRDVTSWNSMIFGYYVNGMWECAFELFERMSMGNVERNTVTWNTIAGGCLRMSNYRGALTLLSQMRDRGVDLDYVTLGIGLTACSQTGFIKIGKEIHGYAVRSCRDGLEEVRNASIMMYSRCNDLGHAALLFQLTEDKSIITWSAMIAGCIFLERYEGASSVFREMLESGTKPNYVTITSILSFCARTMNLSHGKEIHCNIMKQKELKGNILLWNSLVDLYSKSGKILEAQRVFDSMSVKDKVSYTSLIAGYGMQGQGQVALNLFEEMTMHGIKPDHITMVVVLSACSRSGLVFEGQRIFKGMINVYNIYPQIEHFSCMVDLYGTAGLLREAVQLISEMPYVPSRAMLATLVRASRIHGDTIIMEWAMKLLARRLE